MAQRLIDMHLVPDARELLGAGEPCRAGADDGDLLAGLGRRPARALSPCAMARSAMAHSIDLMVTGFSSILSVQDASQGAGQTRPVTSGKLLVECRLRAASSQWPVIDEIVPVGDLVIDRAARRPRRHGAGALAIGHAAIHAARGLGDVVRLRQRHDEFAPMMDALARPARSRGPCGRIRESR